MVIRKQYIIPLVAILCLIALLMLPPIPQDQNYHDFADNRKLWHIPNFLNVITNLPFAIVGLLGLQITKHIEENKLKHIFFTLFTGFLLLTFGSGYYHLFPTNNNLVYDRVPIVIILMSFFASIIYTCLDEKTGYDFFFILNVVGVMSVVYWGFSESIGKGDLRWYGLIQFFPIVAIPLILIMYKPSITFKKEIVFIFLFFVLAKLKERFDKEIYHLLSNTISGHSLKHLFIGAAGYKIVVMVRKFE